MFDWLGKHWEKVRRFTSAVSILVPAGQGADFLADAFDWASLGTGIVVDVGGGTCGISILLTKTLPNLIFVVQDPPEVIDGAEITIPVKL